MKILENEPKNLLNLNAGNIADNIDNSIQIQVIDTYPAIGIMKEKDYSDFRGRIEDYKFIKEIGKGSYASVKSAVHKPTGKKYAIKIYEKYKLMDPAKKAAVKREIQILKKIDHENIPGLIEVIDETKQVGLI